MRVTGGPTPRSGILVAVKDPGHTTHWWYSKADRGRIERLSDQIDEAHHRAETASDEERGRYLRSIRRLERTRRTHRTYPLSIWFWGASIVVVILPWSILARAGHPGIGWAISAVALVGIIFVRWRLKQRQNKHTATSRRSDEESA
jgi:Flp pilus assembly protein TadB